MEIKSVTHSSFAPYGKVLTDYDTAGLLEEMKHTPLPEGEVIYVPSDPALEKLPAAADFQMRAFGGLPIQIGYCNGHNHLLNALEYHRNSEINIAVTDLILLLGRQQDITEDFTYDTGKVEAFLVPAGTALEVYATTLHYAPVSVNNQNFRCVVILPKGTNEDLPCPPYTKGEERLLAAVNKWLIAHEDAHITGAFNGLKGENIEL